MSVLNNFVYHTHAGVGRFHYFFAQQGSLMTLVCTSIPPRHNALPMELRGMEAEILRQIARHERRDPRHYSFLEVRTCLGYPQRCPRGEHLLVYSTLVWTPEQGTPDYGRVGSQQSIKNAEISALFASHIRGDLIGCLELGNPVQVYVPPRQMAQVSRGR